MKNVQTVTISFPHSFNTSTEKREHNRGIAAPSACWAMNDTSSPA